MKSITFIILIATLSCVLIAQQTVMIGGDTMFPKREIVSNTMNVYIQNTVVLSGVVVLQKEHGFTVFAPLNHAFAKLSQGREALLLHQLSQKNYNLFQLIMLSQKMTF